LIGFVVKKYLKIFFLCTIFAVHSLFSLSEGELKYQFQQLFTKSVDASIYDSTSSLKRSFDLFLKSLLRMSDRPSLQINFVNLFFYKAVLLDMVSIDDISLIADLYAGTRARLDELLDRAKAQIWVNSIDPEKGIERIEGLMIALLAVFDSATSSDCFFCSNQEGD